MFNALDPTMKTEASARRALEKCMLKGVLVRFLFYFGRLELMLKFLKSETDRCETISFFLYLKPVKSQASHNTDRKRINRTELLLDMGLRWAD